MKLSKGFTNQDHVIVGGPGKSLDMDCLYYGLSLFHREGCYSYHREDNLHKCGNCQCIQEA